uniref:Gem-associated protein 2 n=1 Tax=Aceria tosichella TaxID=561515 RepID=A0A6G1SNK7_9ACAR
MSWCESYCGDYEFNDDGVYYESDDSSIEEDTIHHLESSKDNDENAPSDDQYDIDADESDADGEIGVRALAFDPNQLSNSSGLPVNGHDYLKLVQEERKRLPAIVTVQPPPSLPSAKKSTQSSTIPMEVLHYDEEIGADQENCMPSQQSSFHPMDTSILRESHIASSSSSSLSSDEEQSVNNCSIYSSMASKEFREQLRLKSLGCTRLKTDRVNRYPTSMPSTSNVDRDLMHRDEILKNFLKLRAQIESIRGLSETNPGEHCDIDNKEDEEPNQQKSSAKRSGARSDRRVANLIKNMNLGHPPQLTGLVHKSQRDIHSTLERLADQCEKAPIYSTLHADWIYSLIALLREPIEPDICSTLRRLAKLCMTRRDSYERRSTESGLSSQDLMGTALSKELVDAINDEEYYACLLIICIVRYHFGQADLR